MSDAFSYESGVHTDRHHSHRSSRRSSSRRRHHHHRRPSRPPSPSEEEEDTDVHSEAYSESTVSPRDQRHRSHRDEMAIVKRDPYIVQAPPQVYQPSEYTEDYEEEYDHRDRGQPHRQRRAQQREQREAGILLALAAVAFSLFLCWDECCD